MATKMLKLRGGETLNKQKEVQKYNLADALVDMRYYPFKPTLPENVSTDTAEFVTYEAKSLTSNILEFEVEPSTSGYLDLANSYVMVSSKLQYNGADLSFNVPTQRILAEPWQSLLMFKDVKTYVNNKEVSDQHDGGIYPYTALHKALLTEKNCDPVIGGTQVTNTNGTTSVVPLNATNAKNCYEDIYDWGATDIDSPLNTNPVLLEKYNKVNGFREYSTGTTTIVCLRDGIWTQKGFLPPSSQLRIPCVKNDVLKIARFDTSLPPTATLTVLFQSATLYLRRCFPTEQTIESINQLAVSVPRAYPIMRASSTYDVVPDSLCF